MPCPEKFRESLEKFEVDPKIREEINHGYEDILSKSPKKRKAAYFRQAIQVMDGFIEPEKKQEILEWNACCKSGQRQKASKAFAKENDGLPLEEKLKKISQVQYMGVPELNEDGTITVHAVSYWIEDHFSCGCSNFNGVKLEAPVSKSYCYCCGGHFLYHYEIMLGKKLKVKEVVSSPLDSNGKNPCVFRLEIVHD